MEQIDSLYANYVNAYTPATLILNQYQPLIDQLCQNELVSYLIDKGGVHSIPQHRVVKLRTDVREHNMDTLFSFLTNTVNMTIGNRSYTQLEEINSSLPGIIADSTKEGLMKSVRLMIKTRYVDISIYPAVKSVFKDAQCMFKAPNSKEACKPFSCSFTHIHDNFQLNVVVTIYPTTPTNTFFNNFTKMTSTKPKFAYIIPEDGKDISYFLQRYGACASRIRDTTLDEVLQIINKPILQMIEDIRYLFKRDFLHIATQ